MLRGKSALVLGGSRGIGAAIVRSFVAEGATVAFTYASSQQAADALAAETGARVIRADSADRDALTGAVAAAGALDILVVNAGVLVVGDPTRLDPAAVDHLFDVNIRAPYFAIAEAGKTMREDGRVIVIGSVNGDRIPVPGATAYAMSKSAMQGMARGFARDFSARRITVNVIQPGPVATDMNPEDGPNADRTRAAMAIRRYAQPREIADLAVYLASEKAGMITGSMVTIDGGLAT